MRLAPGAPVVPFELPALDGRMFSLDELAGRPYLLALFRFAACPFCNLRMHELVARFPSLGPAFTVVAVFDSPLDNLRRFATRHDAPFPVLADKGGRVHRRYGVEQSLAGTLRGMVLRMPTLMKAMLTHGYLPTRLRGSLTTMPADFLVGPDGRIREAWYGRDEGDHLPMDQVQRYSWSPA